MYITNDPAVAKIAEASGVDRIFIDMEYIGKGDRQGGMDTVQSHHTPADIARVKAAVSKAKLMVRVNPIHNATADYGSSKEEIDAAVEAGADILMLPYFKTPEEVAEFVRLVDGRAITLPLVETPEAAERIDEILLVEGIDEIFVGLNDLSLGYGMSFMFQLLADGTVERLCGKFREKGIPYGFGGIAAIGQERVIAEHYRLGSECVILSRSFCNATGKSLDEVQAVFEPGVAAIRARETECGGFTPEEFESNRQSVVTAVAQIREIIAAKKKA